MRDLMTPVALLLACVVGGTVLLNTAVESERPGPNRPPVAVTDSMYRDGGGPDSAKVELGRVHCPDREHRHVAGSTSHHPTRGTADGLPVD